MPGSSMGCAVEGGVTRLRSRDDLLASGTRLQVERALVLAGEVGPTVAVVVEARPAAERVVVVAAPHDVAVAGAAVQVVVAVAAVDDVRALLSIQAVVGHPAVELVAAAAAVHGVVVVEREADRARRAVEGILPV